MKIPYHLSCLLQHLKAYSDNWIGKPEAWGLTANISSHIPFADDFLICANTPHELQQLLQKLNDESKNQGLTTNKSKAKVMMENNTYIDTNQWENVESYVYPWQIYSISEKEGSWMKSHDRMANIRQAPRHLQE